MPQFNADVIPDVEGRNCGVDGQRFNVFARDLNVTGNVSGSFAALAVNKLTHTVIAFTATPVFPATQGTGFQITLTGNVTGSSITGLIAGMLVAFVIKQDGVGGRGFVWPLNVLGGADIGLAAGETTTQLFYSDGTYLYALTPGVIQ